MEKGADPSDHRPLFYAVRTLSVSCQPSSSRPWLSLPLSVIPPFVGSDLSAQGMVSVDHPHTRCGDYESEKLDVKHKSAYFVKSLRRSANASFAFGSSTSAR